MSQSERAKNHLAGETSPYLLQHVHNPVDWYPWGEEAFEKARREDKPIFLSVGYSACHWCHVMERESFENDDIADLLNRHYVSIKVDREERPDVDQIYMSAVQLITHRGGWPMSVFLTPDGKPFYGGTYWPPTSRSGMPGFRDVLLKLHDYWVNKRDEVVHSADELVEAIERMAAPAFRSSSLGEPTLQHGMKELISSADRRHGGFGGAPKFPHPMDLRLLMRCARRFNHDDALDVVRLTLDKMARGGIYDHLGGGFHRYSTDAYWLVPHFEKMLYDNALLVPAYLEAFQITGSDAFAAVARETLDYILREMTQPQGGFYSTQDADSEGEEGKFFVWSEEEILSLLDAEQARPFNYCYDVTPRGNWEGHCVLNRPKPHDEAARVLGVDPQELQRILDRCRQKLFEVRSRRVPPGRDEKILVSWNGLAIAAFAQAAHILNDPRYAQAATQAAEFIWERMRNDCGRLLHSFKDDQARFTAYLDDYACLIDGLAELYQATFDARFVDWGTELAEQMLAHFADDAGGFFYTPDDHEQLIARTKDSQDNATPSGNGMAATALLKLGRLCDRSDFIEAARKTLDALSGLIAEHPRATAQALLALDLWLGPARSAVIVDGTGDDAPAVADAFLRELSREFLPGTLRLRLRQNEPIAQALQSHFQGRSPQPQTQCYVCTDNVCQAPVQSPDGLRSVLASINW